MLQCPGGRGNAEHAHRLEPPDNRPNDKLELLPSLDAATANGFRISGDLADTGYYYNSNRRTTLILLGYGRIRVSIYRIGTVSNRIKGALMNHLQALSLMLWNQKLLR